MRLQRQHGRQANQTRQAGLLCHCLCIEGRAGYQSWRHDIPGSKRDVQRRAYSRTWEAISLKLPVRNDREHAPYGGIALGNPGAMPATGTQESLDSAHGWLPRQSRHLQTGHSRGQPFHRNLRPRHLGRIYQEASA